MKRHARQRASAHPPDAQRQGLAHGGLPLLAARLVQRGQPLLGCRLRLGARLGARLVHLARGYCSVSRARPFMERHACLQLCSTTPCPMPPHAEHAQPSRPRSVAYKLCGTRLGRCSQLPRVHSRLRACLASSARSRASAAAKRCSTAASTSSSASVRASSTWAHCIGQLSVHVIAGWDGA
jgi:hypothetical protein